MSAIRVLLADDHGLVRSGIASLLAATDEVSVVGDVNSGFEVIRFLKEHAVDVAVVDIKMPGPQPAELVEACRGIARSIEFVALTMHDVSAIVQRVLGTGFMGYVHKDDAFDDLVSAIQAAARHQVFKSRSQKQPRESFIKFGEPSEREQHVLRAVSAGKTNKKIAQELKISVKTVETYRSRLMKKLNVHSAPELIHVATLHGWL